MADPSEIQNVIAAQVAAIVYPNGTGSPAITGTTVNVYAGWPLHGVLDADIQAGTSHISVFPLAGEQKIATAMGRPYRQVTRAEPTVVATAGEARVTFSGSVASPQNVYLLLDGVGYHYAVQAADSLTTIATALATLIPNASSLDTVVNLPNAGDIVARVGGVGTEAQELRRQTKEFMVSIWAPTTVLRDALGGALDSALSIDSNLALSDNLPAFMVYARSQFSQNTQIYRRDLIFTVNYATSKTVSATQVVAPVMVINDQSQSL